MNDSSPEDQGFRLPELLERVPDRAIFLSIGLLQGLAAWGLVENGDWLTEHPVVAYPLWLLVLVWPSLFMLSFMRQYSLRALAWVSGFCALLALLALYTGWQASPYGEFETDFVVTTFALSMLVAIFVALIHLQPAVWRTQRDYDTFFTLSWRNFLTVGLSGALTLGVRLVLFLWESLFGAIGVEFFRDLFAKEWFMLPVLGASFSFGLHSFRAATSVIDSISSLLARLIWLLLPLLALLCISFLVTLPFTGLQPLWDTDRGTFILMAANLSGLFFLNAVYQTGSSLPYPLLAHRALTLAVVLFPILSALSFYGLALRIFQYGWTVSRCWALLIIFLMALFSLGYAYIIIRRREGWPSTLPWINKHMSWVVLASLLLTASPLLDFRSISVWSQFSQLESGEVALEDLDVRYLSRGLARPGHLRIHSLVESLEASDPEAAQRLRIRLGQEKGSLGWTADQQARIVMRPEPFEVSADLAHAIDRGDRGVPDLLFRLDLGGGEDLEYVSVKLHPSSNRAYFNCFGASGEEWESCGRARLSAESYQELLKELSEQEFEAVVPEQPYKDLRVGEHLLEFN